MRRVLLALALAAEGAVVVATDLQAEAGAALVDEVAAGGGRARFL